MVKLIYGDCAEADADGFDVLIVDPPYSEHVHKNATSQSRGRGTRHRDLGFDHLSDNLRSVIAHQAASVRRWSLIYSDIEGLHSWREACLGQGATYIRTIPWVRWSMPSLCAWPPQGCEMIQVCYGTAAGRKSWNGPGSLTHLAHKCLRGEGKHKAEKPLDAMLDLVSWFSNPGERVLDPCAGAGTVGLACRLLGRDYVGYEIDPVWAGKAQARIENPQLSERDEDRYRRWKESQQVETAAKAKRDANTAKVRAKNGPKNSSKGGAGSETAGGGGCSVPDHVGGAGGEEGQAPGAPTHDGSTAG